MTSKTELEERLVRVTKELYELIYNFYIKFKELHEEQNLLKVKLEGKHYENT